MEKTPGGDDGFSVDPAQLGGAAGQVGRAYDDLNTAIIQYTGQTPASPGDFGSEVSRAWSNFDSAWGRELGVLSRAVSETIGKITTTTANYEMAERSSQDAAERVTG